MTFLETQQHVSVFSSSGATSSTTGVMSVTALRWGNTVFLAYIGQPTGTASSEIRLNSVLPVGFRPTAHALDLAALATAVQALYFSIADTNGDVRMIRRQMTAAGGFISANMLGNENLHPALAFSTNDPMPVSRMADPFIGSQMEPQIISGGNSSSGGVTAAGNWRAVKVGAFVWLAFNFSVTGTTGPLATFGAAMPVGFRPAVTRTTWVNSVAGTQSMYFADVTTSGNFQVYRRQSTAAGGFVAADFLGTENLSGSLVYLV